MLVAIEKAVISKKNEVEMKKPELGNLKILFYLYAFLIVSLIVMPQYFGIHIGYDITCSRLADILILFYMVLNPKIFTHFFKTVFRCSAIYPLLLYLCVAGYTMILRVDINAFFMVFLEVLNFCLVIYGIRYVVGYKRALKWVNGCAYFLAFYGIVEYLYGQSIFHKFLSTVPNAVSNMIRSGHYRIMGPCGHSLGYGLLLLILLAIACYDYNKNVIFIFRRPFLLMLLLVNVFLTGSRSTLGICVLELFIMFFLQRNVQKKKSLVIIGGILVVFVAFLFCIQNTQIGQYLLGQLASIFDELFGTNYAAQYGIEIERLEDSSNYRKALPYIFTLDWLNPLVGRGNRFSGAEINGVAIQSIDNYYVAQYIKFAYPGLVTYVAFIVTSFAFLCTRAIKKHSRVASVVMLAFTMYFFNLWWVDALQTLKFVYVILAVAYAEGMEKTDRKNREINKNRRVNKGESSVSQCSSSGI